MSFLVSNELGALGVDHGFGTIQSESAEIASLHQVKQVHGKTLLEVPPLASDAEADALWTRKPGAAVAIRTADCVPILIAAPTAVAAVHAGWRGSALQITAHVVAALCDALQVDPAEFTAVIGPHIGPCCYEVDAPVFEAVADGQVFQAADDPGHWKFDLHALNRRQLLVAGLKDARILRVGECTSCHPERYRSYRRDGTGGRMFHYIRCPRARS